MGRLPSMANETSNTKRAGSGLVAVSLGLRIGKDDLGRVSGHMGGQAAAF